MTSFITHTPVGVMESIRISSADAFKDGALLSPSTGGRKIRVRELDK